jgi:hypothetical protein
MSLGDVNQETLCVLTVDISQGFQPSGEVRNPKELRILNLAEKGGVQQVLKPLLKFEWVAWVS